MPELFARAREAVDKIWDYNERRLKDGVRRHDIDNAWREIDAIDDSLLTTPDLDDMKTLLSMTVREAEKEFDYQNKDDALPFGDGDTSGDEFAAIDNLSLDDIRRMVGATDEDVEMGELSREEPEAEEVEEEQEEANEEDEEYDDADEIDEKEEKRRKKAEKRKKDREEFEAKKKRQAEERRKQESYETATTGAYTYGGFNEEQEQLREAEMARRQAEQEELIRRNEELANEAQLRARNEQKHQFEKFEQETPETKNTETANAESSFEVNDRKRPEPVERTTPYEQTDYNESNSYGFEESSRRFEETFEPHNKNDEYKQEYTPNYGNTEQAFEVKQSNEAVQQSHPFSSETERSIQQNPFEVKTENNSYPADSHTQKSFEESRRKFDGVFSQPSDDRQRPADNGQTDNRQMTADNYQRPAENDQTSGRPSPVENRQTEYRTEPTDNHQQTIRQRASETRQPTEDSRHHAPQNDGYQKETNSADNYQTSADEYKGIDDYHGPSGYTGDDAETVHRNGTWEPKQETHNRPVDVTESHRPKNEEPIRTDSYAGSLEHTYGEHFRDVVSGQSENRGDSQTTPYMHTDNTSNINHQSKAADNQDQGFEKDYSYGRGNTSGSKYRDEQAQAREDDYVAAKMEKQKNQDEWVSGLAQGAREAKASSDAFSESRHSSMKHNDEGVEQHRTTIENVSGDTSQKTDDTSKNPFVTPHQSESSPFESKSSSQIHAERVAEAREAERAEPKSAGASYGENVKAGVGVGAFSAGTQTRQDNNAGFARHDRETSPENRKQSGPYGDAFKTEEGSYREPFESKEDSYREPFEPEEKSASQIHAERVAEAREAEKAPSQSAGAVYGNEVKAGVGVGAFSAGSSHKTEQEQAIHGVQGNTIHETHEGVSGQPRGDKNTETTGFEARQGIKSDSTAHSHNPFEATEKSASQIHAERVAEAREADKKEPKSAGASYGENVKAGVGVGAFSADTQRSGTAHEGQHGKTEPQTGAGFAPDDRQKLNSNPKTWATTENKADREQPVEKSPSQIHAERVTEAREAEKTARASAGSAYGESVKAGVGVGAFSGNAQSGKTEKRYGNRFNGFGQNSGIKNEENKKTGPFVDDSLTNEERKSSTIAHAERVAELKEGKVSKSAGSLYGDMAKQSYGGPRIVATGSDVSGSASQVVYGNRNSLAKHSAPKSISRIPAYTVGGLAYAVQNTVSKLRGSGSDVESLSDGIQNSPKAHGTAHGTQNVVYVNGKPVEIKSRTSEEIGVPVGKPKAREAKAAGTATATPVGMFGMRTRTFDSEGNYVQTNVDGTRKIITTSEQIQESRRKIRDARLADGVQVSDIRRGNPVSEKAGDIKDGILRGEVVDERSRVRKGLAKSGKGVSVAKLNKNDIKEKQEESRDIKAATPFEYHTGAIYAKRTKNKIKSNIAGIAGAGVLQAGRYIKGATYDETLAGRGLNKVQRDTKKAISYAHMGIAIIGAANASVRTAWMAGSVGMGNAFKMGGNAMGRGWSYFKGENHLRAQQEVLEKSMGVKKGGEFVSISRKSTEKRLFEMKGTKVRVFDSTGAAVLDKNGKQQMAGLLDKYLKKDKKGKEFIDTNLLSKDIEALQRRIRKKGPSAVDAVELKKLNQIMNLSKSMKNAEKFQAFRHSLNKGARSVRSVGRSIVMYMGSTNNVMGKGVATAYMVSTVALSTSRATFHAVKWIHGTRPMQVVRDHTVKPVAKLAGKGLKKAGDVAGQGLRAAGSSSADIVRKSLRKTSAGNRVLDVKKKYVDKMKKGLNGGIYNRVKETKIGKVGGKIGEGAKKIGGAVGTAGRFVAKPVKIASKAVQAVTNPIKATVNVVTHLPVYIFKKIPQLIWKVIPAFVKFWIIVALLVLIGLVMLATVIGIGITTLHNTIDTDVDNLQKYINYTIEQSHDWYAGKLPDSKVDVNGNKVSLDDVYAKGGGKTDKYRIITTRYVDSLGREVESSDNIKEILSMVAVKTQNHWPDNWDNIQEFFGADKWTVKEVQGIIKHLYAMSHTWTANEKGPYVYYREVNKKKVKLLKTEHSYAYEFSYPSSSYEYQILTGDADEEACRGPRDFKCNETYEESGDLGEYYSQYRRKMIESYKARGGCTIDYSGYGTYNSATDTIDLDGSLHDMTTTINDAAQQIWATENMINRYNLAQENKFAKENGLRVTVGTDTNAFIIDGEGDDLKLAHGLNNSTKTQRNLEEAPDGWVHYDEVFSKYAHGTTTAKGGYMGTDVEPFCDEDDCLKEYVRTDISNEYGLPIYGSGAFDSISIYDNGNWWAEFRWDPDNYRYKSVKSYQQNGVNYIKVITDGAWSYNSATWDDTLWYRYDTTHSRWVPHSGTEYTDVYNYYCQHKLYNYTCHDYEAYCNGHRARVVIYYCPGHQEWYCDCNHYDLDVDIKVLHFKMNQLFKQDVENTYDYKRKAVAVSKYPPGTDKLAENKDSDFFWDYENIEHAKGLANSKWTELYDGITGVDDIDVELVSDDLAVYLEYIDCRRIREWRDVGGVRTPIGLNGNPIEFAFGAGVYSTGLASNTQWFYDETYRCYMKVKETMNVVGGVGGVQKSYEILTTRPTSPSAVSAPRRRFIEIALQTVGKIPYADLDTSASGKIMVEPTLALAQKTKIDVQGEKVTLGLDDAFQFGKDPETGEINYDDYEHGLDSGGFVNYVLCLLDKSLRTDKYHLSYTHEIKKMWEGKTTLLGTRKTIKEEDLLPGDIGFINGYGTNNFDNRKNDFEEAIQSDEELMPYNTVGIYLGTNTLGEKVWIQCSKSSQTVAVTTSNAFNYFRRINAFGDLPET